MHFPGMHRALGSTHITKSRGINKGEEKEEEEEKKEEEEEGGDKHEHEGR